MQDNRPRHVCRLCGCVHYENPKLVCGCLVTSAHQVLLCKRGIEPRKGLWTLPAGFLERNETSREGAERETNEEACAEVTIASLYVQYDLSYISQNYLFFLADLKGSFACGNETLDVRLFTEDAIPWDALAFPVIRKTLELYFSDRQLGTYPHRYFEIPSRSSWLTP